MKLNVSWPFNTPQRPPMTRIDRVHSRFGSNPRLKIGDRVVVKPENQTGVVIGVRYGEIAYDVRCGSECLRNLSPTQVRRAPPLLSVVEASLWQRNLWVESRLANALVKVPT
jgi:hypothetical protein